MTVNVIYFDKVFPELKVLLESYYDREQLSYWYELDNEQKEKALSTASCFLVGPYLITEELIRKAPNLKLIQKSGIGVDNINVRVAKELGIPVCNTPGGNATAVSELTIAMILNLYRKINIIDNATKSGEWQMWEHRPSSFEMSGKTHGFIGFGNIGRETAKRSKAFGTNIIYYDKYRASTEVEKDFDARFMSIDEVLENADIVSVHVPLLPETKHLISNREFSLMKSNAILINVSRGNVVDEEALLDALTNKVIRGAGLDVWSSEPINPNNPLLKLDNIIATPHIGAGTRETLQNVLRMAFHNIKKVRNGEKPDFIVNETLEITN